jgi:serine/threonine protein kinase/Flp pilus assembly protein TadD
MNSMSDYEELPDRLAEIFHEANAMPAGKERERYVLEACGNDVSLHEEVTALLAAHGRAGAFMAGGFGDSVTLPFPAPEVRDRIGPYTLLEKIGEGGFGVVWVAEQTVPVKRRVALKIIKTGMDSAQVISRFEAERHALALMDHPNIARVLDAGTTDQGRPYIVMELVRGVTITDYCDEKHLSPRQRLELFVPVCQAVQHAHQKGIIHRDLKPTNVIVTLYDGRPVPKVIDFGVAKATGPKVTDATLFTQFGQVVGTLEYMSPEQAELNQLDIDTRSDIYSLGVLLYELLTGTTPLDRKRMKEAAFLEILRIIREEEPAKPSTRLSSSEALPSVAAHRDLGPAKLTKLVRGELDWIVMKALEKDRGRRYETANGFAADVLRYLSDEPVLACPRSAWYRLRKFVSRHKWPVIATVAVVAALIAGVVGTSIGLVGESRQRALAEEKRGEALRQKAEAVDARGQTEMVIRFLTNDVLDAVASHRLPDKVLRDQIIEVMIDPAVALLDEGFDGEPRVEAALRYTLARIYESVGNGDLALLQVRKSLAIRRRTVGDFHPDTLETLSLLGTILRNEGKLEEAEPVSREALAGDRQVRGDDDLETIESMNSLALLLNARDKTGEAESLLREALERSRRAHHDDHIITIKTCNNLGWLLLTQGRLDEAEPLVTEALTRGREVLTNDHRGTIRAINNMGLLLLERGKLAETEVLWSEGLERSRRVLGDNHPDTFSLISDMGSLLMEQGKFDQVEPLAREALEGRTRVLGDDHPDTLTSLNNLGVFLRRWGKLDEAEPLIREALARSGRVLGEDHTNTLYSLRNLGDLLYHQKKLDDAEKVYIDLLDRTRRVLPANHPLRLTAMHNLGSFLLHRNKLVEAEPLLREVLTERRRLLSDTHQETLSVAHDVAELFASLGKPDQAEVLMREVLTACVKEFHNEHLQVAGARIGLGRSLFLSRKYTDAESELLEAERVLSVAPEASSRHRARCFEVLAEMYDHWEAAEPGNGYGAKAATWRAKTP